MKFSEIEWLEPRSSAKHSKEVRVIHSESRGTAYTDIVFYDGANKKITKGDYVTAGCTASRIYFAEVPAGMRGFKVRKQSKTTNILQLKGHKLIPGEYDLIFDAECSRWFIGTR